MSHRNCLDELIQCLNNCRERTGRLERILCAAECLTDFVRCRLDEIIAKLPHECRVCFTGRFEEIFDDILLGFLLARLIVDNNDNNHDNDDNNDNDCDDNHNDDGHHHHDHKHGHNDDHHHHHEHEHRQGDDRDNDISRLKALLEKLQEEIVNVELETENLKAQR